MADSTEAGHYVEIAINLDEDWNTPFPPLVNPDGTRFDFTDNNAALELHIRPQYDHARSIAVYTTADAIRFDDGNGGVDGLASIFVARTELLVTIPPGIWRQFLLLRESGAGPETTAYREIWRGPFTVYAGDLEPLIDLVFDFSNPLGLAFYL